MRTPQSLLIYFLHSQNSAFPLPGCLPWNQNSFKQIMSISPLCEWDLGLLCYSSENRSCASEFGPLAHMLIIVLGFLEPTGDRRLLSARGRHLFVFAGQGAVWEINLTWRDWASENAYFICICSFPVWTPHLSVLWELNVNDYIGISWKSIGTNHFLLPLVPGWFPVF